MSLRVLFESQFDQLAETFKDATLLDVVVRVMQQHAADFHKYKHPAAFLTLEQRVEIR